MRFVQILLVALFLSLAWQTQALAALSVNAACVAAEDDGGQKPAEEGGQEGEDEEPECD